MLSEMQLDALREVANIGSGNAATALSQMIGLPVELNVPTADVLPLAEAVDCVGPGESEVSAAVLPVVGSLDAIVLLLFPIEHAHALCGLLGVPAGDDDMETSALGEVGNILGSSYLGALEAMTGLDIEPQPPLALTDMLGAIVASALAATAADTDLALLLDSELMVDGAGCSFSFLFVPGAAGIAHVLDRLGLGDAT